LRYIDWCKHFSKMKYWKTIQLDKYDRILQVIQRLEYFLRDEGSRHDAEALGSCAVGIAAWILGAEHPDTLTSMSNLASMYRAQGRTAEAAALEEEVLEKCRRILGAEHPDTLTSMGNLASTDWNQGRTAEAVELRLFDGITS